MCIFCLGLGSVAKASCAEGFASLSCETLDDASPSAATEPAPATGKPEDVPSSGPESIDGADSGRSMDAMFAPS
jgi:hypothetical protein